MKQRLVTLVLSVVLTATASAAAFAQGGATSSLAGTVTDTSGAVLPGVSVTAKHNGTGTVSTAVTADNGTFHIPALNPGAYTVTMTLSGFKTAALNHVIVNVGVPAAVRAPLEVGGLAETIVVEGATPIVQTRESAVATDHQHRADQERADDEPQRARRRDRSCRASTRRAATATAP